MLCTGTNILYGASTIFAMQSAALIYTRQQTKPTLALAIFTILFHIHAVIKRRSIWCIRKLTNSSRCKLFATRSSDDIVFFFFFFRIDQYIYISTVILCCTLHMCSSTSQHTNMHSGSICLSLLRWVRNHRLWSLKSAETICACMCVLGIDKRQLQSLAFVLFVCVCSCSRS